MVDIYDEAITNPIKDLIELCGKPSDTFEADLIMQMIQTCLRLMTEGFDNGQLKLINRALKEMRYAYRVFNQHKKNTRCVSIFGSARTPHDHADYLAAKAFSSHLAKLGWMCITGASEGIMKAGHEGSEKESSFGLSIRLPFEITTNSVIEGDPKLIIFRYFFTRKLMFLSHSDAIAAFPGGFGTLDELFEVLTLIQTGKTSIVPIVLVEGIGGSYWKNWEKYLKEHILSSGWISEEDQNLYYIAANEKDAIQHILKFYHRYHSSRYVKELLVIRLLTPLTEEQVDLLNSKFSTLKISGMFQQTSALPEESDYLTLPRLVFHHSRKHFGTLRLLIDAINNF